MADNSISARTLQSEILHDEFARRVILDMGYAHEDERAQASMLSDVGEILLMRLTLEMLKRLPLESADAFDKLIGAGDMDAIRDLMSPHIHDLDGFIQMIVEREYEKVKAKMLETELAVDADNHAYTYL